MDAVSEGGITESWVSDGRGSAGTAFLEGVDAFGFSLDVGLEATDALVDALEDPVFLLEGVTS